MVNFVKTQQLISENGVQLTSLNWTTGTVNALTRDIPCPGTDIVGAFWRIPIVVGAKIGKYEYSVALDSSKPTPDSLKVLRVKHGNDTYEMAIADTDYITTADRFATLCDGLGGTLATMPDVTIPFPIFQDAPSSTNTTTGTKTFTFSFPNNPLALLYSIPWPWFNGAAPSPAYAPSGITTPAGFVTWANANWATYGTWANPGAGNIITLASPTSAGTPISAAGMSVALTPQAWCLDITALSTGTNINGIQIGTAPVIPIPAFIGTSTSYQNIINAIKPHLEEGAVLVQTVANKITITTVSAAVKILNGVTVLATATVGTC